MKHVVLKFWERNTNGRIYSADDCRFEETGFVYANSDACETGNLDAIVGTYSNMKIENDKLVCDIELLQLVKNLKPITSGHGMVETLNCIDGVVTDYQLDGLFLTEQSAWR